MSCVVKVAVNFMLAGAGLLASTVVCAAEFPVLKPGLWETRIQYSAEGKTVGAPATQHCLDEAAAAHAKLTGDEYMKKNCSKYAVRQDGAAWVVDMECKSGANTMITHSSTTFAGAGAYHTDVTISYAPPAPGSHTVMDGKWLGTCKAE